MKIEIRPLSSLEKFIDFLMTPLMYLVSVTFREKPQQTHKWNIRKISPEQKASLDEKFFLVSPGADSFIRKHWGILFHIPIIGGWKEYILLKPILPEIGWRIGWGNEVSAIVLYGPVRMLKGPHGQSFFALSLEGEQLALLKSGEGKIGDRSRYSRFPLL